MAGTMEPVHAEAACRDGGEGGLGTNCNSNNCNCNSSSPHEQVVRNDPNDPLAQTRPTGPELELGRVESVNCEVHDDLQKGGGEHASGVVRHELLELLLLAAAQVLGAPLELVFIPSLSALGRKGEEASLGDGIRVGEKNECVGGCFRSNFSKQGGRIRVKTREGLKIQVGEATEQNRSRCQRAQILDYIYTPKWEAKATQGTHQSHNGTKLLTSKYELYTLRNRERPSST